MTKFYLRPNTYDSYIVNEQESYFKLINPTKEDRWLDIGANIGAFASFLAPLVKSVICIEPEPENFKRLTMNIKLNSVVNADLLQKAVVGNNDKTRTFHVLKHSNKGLHSLISRSDVAEQEEIKVECVKLGKLIKDYDINKIKLDVEGAEYEILISADLSNIEELIMEYHFTIAENARENFKPLIGHLYKFFKNIEYTPEAGGVCLVYCKK